PLGVTAREYRQGRRARRHGGLGARGRQRAAAARGRRQPALSRACQAGGPCRGHVPRRRLLRPLCHCGDDDIDVSNLEELIWAVLTRSDPATSIDIIRNAWSTPLDPRIEPERKAAGDYTNSRAIIDACRPWHWRDKFP